MWNGFQSEKLNMQLEIVLAANQTEPENHGEPVPGPNHHKKLNFFQKRW